MHFALGKNMLVGDVFDAGTIMPVTYYGYFIIAGIVLLYWKVIEKKDLAAMGLTKEFGPYFIGIVLNIFLLTLSVAIIAATGSISYQGILKRAQLRLLYWLLRLL